MGSTGQQGGRFVDYFVISGLDPTQALVLDQLAGESCHIHPLQRSYKSNVLHHYPSNVDWNPFDSDGINMLCMPKGLSFRTQKANRQAKFHSFVMTREDSTRTYGAAITFYEMVTSQHICAELQTLQHKFGEDRRQRKASAVEGPTGSMGNIYDSVANSGYRTIGSPRFQRRQSSPNIQGLASPRTRRRSPVHQACYTTTKAYTLPRTHTDAKNPHFDMLKDTLYVSKCVCLIMQAPFVWSSRKFLEQLLEVVASSNSPSLPMESYIFNILYEVPLPPMGRSMVFTGVARNIACQRPSRTELPLCEYPIMEMFRLLGTENVVDLLTCVLLEKQVLLVSRDYQRLMLVAECMCALIFPFTWPYAYVPILPASMLYFLDAPLPFIMGLHLSEANLHPESEMELPTQASLCYVDIENSCVELPEELPSFPNKQTLVRELNSLIQKYKHTRQLPDNSPSQQTAPSTTTVCSSSGGKTTTLSHNKVNDFDWSQVQAEVTLITALNQNLEGSLDGDQDSSYFSSPSRGESPTAGMPSKADFLRNNEIVSRVAEIAQRTGVISSIADYENDNGNANAHPTRRHVSEEEQEHHEYATMLIQNCAIREVFLRRMVVLLRNYETFIIQPRVNSLDWFNNREQMQNFDKNAFLADTPEMHLPFLSPFLETQLFASFIDNKIISNWEEKDQALCIFDDRVENFPSSLPQTPTTEGAIFFSEGEELIRRRANNVDHTPCPPRALPIDSSHVPNFFPMLQDDVLLKPPYTNGRNKYKNNARWKKNERQQQHSEHLNLRPHEREKYINSLHNKKPTRQAVLTHCDQKKANQQFVEELLKECKIKTKKMLVFKMGQEAIELGHGDINRSGVEENTLIASLCDLLERIFSHGCRSKKQSKSALWWHLLSYRRFRQKKKASSEQNLAMSAEVESSPRHRRTSVVPGQLLPALPTDFSFDLKNVDRMTNIRTEVGKSRAFVRLALERKVLHKHIKELVSNDELLKKRYRSEAFLRREEEKMQFLYYLLSLNAVDFHCFTNSFPSTVVTYRVLINQSRKFQAPTTANPWMQVTGEVMQTPVIHIPKSAQDFTFQHNNLGVLTTLRIGHDNAGLLPRWLVDYIYIRNEITGHAYKFPCGRWIGRNVDDGSLERLLVAEFIPPIIDYEGDHFWGSNTTPRRSHARRSSTSASSSPSPPPRVPHKLDQNAIQELLTDAVNNIVKHFYKPEKERGHLTVLLCGECGLVKCMDLVLQYGFRSARLFRNNFFIWDFLEKVARYLDSLDQDEEGRFSSRQEKRARRTFCLTLHQINKYAQTVGKDGKFQLLVCLGVRDHLLHQWLPVLAETPVTKNMYDECSFFHTHHHLDFLCSLLMQLDEFNISLEASVTKGIEL